jgi:hypothetical protein
VKYDRQVALTGRRVAVHEQRDERQPAPVWQDWAKLTNLENNPEVFTWGNNLYSFEKASLFLFIISQGKFSWDKNQWLWNISVTFAKQTGHTGQQTVIKNVSIAKKMNFFLKATILYPGGIRSHDS